MSNSTDGRQLGLSPARAALLDRWKRGRSRATAPGIPKRTTPGPAVLSFAQERLWLLDRFLGPGNAYNTVPLVARLQGPLDVDLLVQSFQEVVRRHDVMRTRFVVTDDGPRQVVGPELKVTVDLTDLREHPDPEAEAFRLARETRGDTFDLAAGPLFRTRLFRVAEHQHILLHLMHHMISDGWSDDVLIREIATSYLALRAGQPPPLPALPIQYADYADWHRDLLTGQTLEDLLGYWRTRLAGAPAVLELPTDGPRPAAQRFVGASHQVRIPRDITARLRELAHAEGATLFMTLLAAVDVFLGRYSGQSDIVVGSPVANRTRPELEGLVGCFINTLVLRTDIAGDPTFRELLSRVREVALGGYAHQELPFERLVEELQPERDTSRNPLFQVMFVLQNSPPTDLEFGDFRLSPVEIDNGVAKFDLTIDLREYHGELVGRIQFDSDLFGPETRERMVSHFLTLVEGIVSRPDRRLSELPLLGDRELDRMLTDWNATAVEYDVDCVHRLIEAQAARCPDAVAVSAADGQLSYRELNRRADRLADSLRLLGVRPDTLVGLCVERSVDLAVGILGILKAGGAYVPLDPTHPVDRLAHILNDAGAPVVVTQRRLTGRLSASSARMVCVDAIDSAADAADPVAVGPEPVEPTPDHLAYVIYTSGSTGQPKGVMISHRAVTNMVLATREETGVGSGDAVLQFATVCFDVSVLEIFLALCTGAKLVIPDSETVLDPVAVTNLLEREQITVFDIPPAVLELLSPDAVTTRRVQFLGCEAFGGELATRWQLPGRRLINGYGPTEATVMMTWTELDRPYTRMPPIGRPMPNHQAYVLDRTGQPVPIGTPGELYIGGVGLARGYLGRPGLTADRFAPDPFGLLEGGRLYRTGDLARVLPDGTLEFLGRADQQVKIRGYRIELPEIEAVLDRHPDVHHAVVVVRDQALSSRHLVAYVQVTRTDCRAAEIRDWLGCRLPGYLVPQVIVPLARLPLLPSGKVDRSALPDPDTVLAGLAGQAEQPRNDTERILSEAVFADVLGTDHFGIHDNFFQLGGNSLHLAKLQTRIAERMGTVVPLRVLFEGPSVAELAEYLDGRSGQESGSAGRTVVSQDAGPGGVPLTWQQEWAITSGRADYKPLAARLKGVVDADAIRDAVREVARRHEMLHTVFTPLNGGWAQRSEPALVPDFAVQDLAGQGIGAAIRVAAAEATREFDVEHGPLGRVLLLRLDDFDHLLVATLHPLLWDGWSRGVFARELLILGDVAMSTEALVPLSSQYADYARWQRDWLAGPEPGDLMRYWRDVMTAPPAPLRLPGGDVRGSAAAGARYPVPLPHDLSDTVLALSRSQGVTLFTVLMSAFTVALHTLTGESDIVVGVPMANRVRPGTADLIGRFVNTLPIRTRLGDDPTVRELLGRVGSAVAGARDHQELPPDLIAKATGGGAPAFTMTFDLLEVAADLPAAVGVEILPVEVPTARTDFELTLAVERRPSGLHASITYATGVYQEHVVGQLAERYLGVLRAMTADPERSLGDLTRYGR